MSQSQRRGLRRRTVLLSGFAGLVAVGVPTGLYLSRATGVGLLAVLGTAVPYSAYSGGTKSLNPAHSTAFHPAGHLLVVFHGDSTVTLWAIDDPSHPTTLAAHGAALHGLEGVFTPDGRTLVTSDLDNTGGMLDLWDLTDPTQARALATLNGLGPAMGQPGAGVSGPALNPSGRVMAAATSDTAGDSTTIRLWDLTDPATPTPLSATTPADYAIIDNLAFSPSGRILAAGSDHATEGSSGLWNVADPRNPTPLGSFAGDSSNGAGSGIFGPDGRILATTGGEGGTVRIWNVADPAHPALLAAFQDHTTQNTSYPEINGLAISPTGRTLATAGPDSNARLWNITDPARPTLLTTLTGHLAALTSVTFSPSGHVLATTSIDQTVRLWDTSGL